MADALTRLHARMLACRLCLAEGHNITPEAVFSGIRSAQVMVIGQAPGWTEVQAKRPFNAGSGRRLFQWLEDAGFEEASFRAQQYMTSVTKCYPGKSAGGGDRVPSRREQELCRPFLMAEIETVDPALILPVGRLAINLYYPQALALTQIIGTEKEAEGRSIVPLPHPSGASRWHQIPENRRLIERATRLIQGHRRRLGL